MPVKIKRKKRKKKVCYAVETPKRHKSVLHHQAQSRSATPAVERGRAWIRAAMNKPSLMSCCLSAFGLGVLTALGLVVFAAPVLAACLVVAVVRDTDSKKAP